MSSPSAELAARLDRLESNVAQQDLLITELNEVITAQWGKIDALERQIMRLRDEFQASAAHRETPEPPPPHY